MAQSPAARDAAFDDLALSNVPHIRHIGRLYSENASGRLREALSKSVEWRVIEEKVVTNSL